MTSILSKSARIALAVERIVGVHRVAGSLLRLSMGLAVMSCRDSMTQPSAAGAKYVVSFSPTAPAAGTTVVAKAQLVDGLGAIVRLAGRKVKWSASAHAPASSSVTAYGMVPSLAVTDSDGVATASLSLTKVAGVSYTVSVADDRGMVGNSDPFPSVAGPPSGYDVAASSTTPQVGSTITVSAQLVDVNRNPIGAAGRVVGWSTLGTARSGSVFSRNTSVTDANGVATADLSVGPTANASFSIFVTDDQLVVGASPSISAIAGPATRYVVRVDSSESNPPAGAPVTVTAQLADANGNAVADDDRAVSWSFTGGGAWLSATATVTEGVGTASVLFTPSAAVGASYTVSAIDASGFNGTTAAITTQPQVSLSSIATGFESSSVCGTSSSGELWCWGDNGVGQLGNGTTSSRYLAVRGATDLKLASVSVGSSFSCGLTAAGAAYCWGDNSDGTLGDGSQTSHTRPLPVASTVTFRSLSAGARHVCAVATTGDAYCWGSNDGGRLGTTTDGGVAPAPVKVSGGLLFLSISAGDTHTCGIVTDGSAYCWGVNGDGQLGDGSTSTRLVPTPVGSGLRFSTISAGAAYTCGVAQGGAGYCWGNNSYAQLGTGTQFGSTRTPAAVAGGLTLGTIAAGGVHTCALTTSGLAYCWGDNSTGELGDGGQISSKQPLPVTAGLHFATIAVSSAVATGGCDYYCFYYGYGASTNAHSCGITTGGVAYCWGSNSSGQLGAGRSEMLGLTPLKVAGQR